MALPDGYKRHTGKSCPVEIESFVDCIIRTAEGLGHSGVMRAKLHDWNPSSHPKGIGAVVAWRPAQRHEIIPLSVLKRRWSE
jgi:hypothetical protein